MGKGTRHEIAVLDFGGQYTHLITKRIRHLGVLARIYAPENFDPERPGVVGIILSGGPDSVDAEGAPQPGFPLSAVKVPLLGLCYGHQLIAQAFGGSLETGHDGEYGLTRAQVDTSSALFAGLDRDQTVWMSHRDRVARLPEGFRIIASSEAVPVAGFEDPKRCIFGLQFHPEVTHTIHGMTILDHFVGLCTAIRDWTPDDYAPRLMEDIRRQAGEAKVIVLVSGGVDSLVALKLLVDALGKERVLGLHVDTGFMREGESAEIVSHLVSLGYRNLKVVDASARFLSELRGEVDPERKRKIVGRLFVDILHETLKDLDLAKGWLVAQGTIYPDTIESGGTDKAATIKTHHNRVAEIEALIAEGRVLEPLKDLYKDEIRDLGQRLGLPGHLLSRHPFPGPGLVIRILCAETATPERAYDREAPRVAAMATEAELESVILPVRSVGVQGDGRTYAHPALLYSVNTSPPPWDVLSKLVARLVNAHHTVNRVVVSPRAIDAAALRLGATFADRAQADRLRQVDALVRARLAHFAEIWQLAVIALPLFDSEDQQVYIVRPVLSTDAMTAQVFPIAWDLFSKIEAEVQSIAGVGTLLYDATTKPPATIEWE